MQHALIAATRHGAGIECTIFDTEQNRLGVLTVDIDLRVVDAARDAVLVVDRDTPHAEFAVDELRAGQVTTDRIDSLPR